MGDSDSDCLDGVRVCVRVWDLKSPWEPSSCELKMHNFDFSFSFNFDLDSDLIANFSDGDISARGDDKK